jgi:bacteriochlorophyllide a dehydrogenase
MQAKAVVFTEKNRIDMQEVILPKMTEQDVLVDVEYSFVSPGTERWCLAGQFHYGSKQNYPFPLVPGYQHTGRVKAVGKDVKSVKPGDRVFALFNRFEGIHSKWGGHCSMSINIENDVFCLPESVSSLEASALMILQVGYNGGSRPPVEPGDIAVVLGDGLIGQFVAQTLRNRGAYVIIAGKGDKERLEYARKYSCDMVIDTFETDLKTKLLELAANGAKIVVEAIGLSENDTLACDLLAHNGHYVLNGFYPFEHRVDLNPLSLKEITVHNPASFTRARIEATMNLLARKKLNVQSLITHVVKSADAAIAYTELILKRKEFSLGVAIDWSDDK